MTLTPIPWMPAYGKYYDFEQAQEKIIETRVKLHCFRIQYMRLPLRGFAHSETSGTCGDRNGMNNSQSIHR